MEFRDPSKQLQLFQRVSSYLVVLMFLHSTKIDFISSSQQRTSRKVTSLEEVIASVAHTKMICLVLTRLWLLPNFQEESSRLCHREITTAPKLLQWLRTITANKEKLECRTCGLCVTQDQLLRNFQARRHSSLVNVYSMPSSQLCKVVLVLFQALSVAERLASPKPSPSIPTLTALSTSVVVSAETKWLKCSMSSHSWPPWSMAKNTISWSVPA